MRFEKAVNFMFENEGGYSDHPLDKGGKTIYGIASKFHPEWFEKVYREYKAIGKNFAKSSAEEFYKENFWNPLYDKLKSEKLAIKLFDLGVNCGVKRVVEELQRVFSVHFNQSIIIDGVFGKRTLGFCNDISQDTLYSLFIYGMSQHYSSLSSWDTFKFGWLNRLYREVK